MSDTILCIDIGTTSLKAALVTAEGGVVSFCSVPFAEPHDRFVACSWYNAFLRAVGELFCNLGGSQTTARVCGISISGNGPTVVTDCGLTFRWNEDTSGVASEIPDCAKTSLFIPKILSVRKQFPEVLKKTKKLFSGPEFFIHILTGQAVTILPEARFTPAYWSDEVCKACGIKMSLLPSFAGTGAKCGFVCDDVMAQLRGLCEPLNGDLSSLVFADRLPVLAGGPDFVVALLGTGTLRTGRLCDRCGSSEGLNFCTDRPVSGDGLRTLPSVISGLWNVSYLIPNSGELSESARLDAVERGVKTLKAAAAFAGIAFPSEMAVTGGQTNDELLLKEKAQRLGMTILRPSDNHFVHSELLGDACAGWFGLGVYDSLQTAAEKIVRLSAYENL